MSSRSEIEKEEEAKEKDGNPEVKNKIRQIQRQMATINFHIYGSRSYLKERGHPKNVKDLQNHTLIGYPASVPAPFADQNWLFRTAGVDPSDRADLLMMNSLYAIHRAVEGGVGLAMLPDYLAQDNENIEIVLPELCPAGVDVFFVYPEERRHSQRIAVFRDFLLKIVSKTRF